MTAKTKAGKNLWVVYSPLLVLWTACVIAHFFFPTDLYDDSWFANWVTENLAGEKFSFSVVLDFMSWRYDQWSSRSLIEGTLAVMVHFPILWRICDTLIFIAITYMLSNLFNPEKCFAKNLILVVCVLLFPLSLLYEVGYVATSLNYMWPLAAALFALTPLIKQFYGREVRKWEYIAAIPMFIVAGFQELICATMILILLGSLSWRAFGEHKPVFFEIGGLIACIIMLIWALTCPGNDNRFMAETATWLPEYAGLNLFQKLDLGFSSMSKTLFFDPKNIFVLFFCLIMATVAHLRADRLWKKLIGWIPACYVLVFGIFGERLAQHLSPVSAMRDSVGKLGTGMTLNPLSWIPNLIFVAIFALLLISLRFAVKDRKQYGFLFFVLGIGAASRGAMGLSPTVWASGGRINTFLYFSMVVVVAYLLLELYREIKESSISKA